MTNISISNLYKKQYHQNWQILCKCGKLYPKDRLIDEHGQRLRFFNCERCGRTLIWNKNIVKRGYKLGRIRRGQTISPTTLKRGINT